MVALAIYLFLRLSPQKIIFSIPIYLLGAWMLLHILNLVFIGGAGNTVLVRLVQCVFIGVLLLSISNRNFCLVEFGKSVAPIVSLAAAVLFLIFLICNLINNEIFELMRVSIIGNPANFSIFCAQLIAFFLLKDLANSTPANSRSYPLLLLSVLPLLLWQLASAGRAGFLLTLFALLGFAFAKHGKRGAVVLIVFSFVIIAGYFVAFDLLANALNFSPAGRLMGGQALLRGIPSLENLYSLQSNEQTFFKALDGISSGRISIIYETLQILNLQTFLFGAGVENFKVLEGQHYPHIELLRYVAELGVLGLAIVTFVYIYPIRRLAKDPIGKFSFFYMLGFMVTTLFQPSGPLTHLNNSFLYWMLFGHIILVEKENFKFMRGGAGGLLRLEQLASKVICLRNTDMNVRFYTLFSTLIFFSGLSIAWLNVPFLNGTVSLIRVGWAGLLIYIVLKITWNREILRHPLVLLFLFWILLHIFNFLILDGAATAILTRIFQASFITALLIIIMQRGFDLATFCKAINPLFSLVAGIALLAFLFASVISSGLFYMIQGSIIGVSSNFSIFCSQLFALFLLKDSIK